MEKVCVRVPANRRAELLQFAQKLRAQDHAKRPQGWDAKVIHQIAREKFGGLEAMYEFHEWEERGSDMMRHVQRHVKTAYGSIEDFAKQFGYE